ncbi:MAG: hypothetical protein B6D36_08360, partial [Planctomycetes bacterium UTPLA1]
MKTNTLIAVGGIVLSLTMASLADEGMWPLNHLPREQLKETYTFEPSEAWVDHVRRSCVRVG